MDRRVAPRERRLERRLRPAWLVLLVLAAPAAGAQEAPEQVHVSLGDGLVVQWAQARPYPPHVEPIVVWEAGGAQTVTPARLEGAVAALQSAGTATATYAATIARGAAAGQDVHYQVGTRSATDPSAWLLGGTHRTKVPPADQLRIVAFGDIGFDGVGLDGRAAGPSPPVRVRDLALAQAPDVVVIPGDLAYDNSGPGWDRFGRFLEPLAASVPTMPVIGNHERQNDLEGYSQFLSRWVLPGDEHDYVFRAGPVTFIGIDSDSVCRRDAQRVAGQQDGCPVGTSGVDRDKVAWLEAALREAAADGTSWTLVYFHHQTHSFGSRQPNEPVMEHWVPLLEKHHVDLVLTAHDHFYVRSHPVRDGQRVGDADGAYLQGAGPVHVVTGGGGRSLYELRDGPLPDHLAHAQAIHHLSRIDASADRLEFAAIEAVNGTLIDSFTIHRHALREPPPDPVHTPLPVVPVMLALVWTACRRARQAPPGA